MIVLQTGLPGNGKTLNAIGWIKDWAARENRPVFFSGIKLTEKGTEELGWQEIDAEKWNEAPPGAIVLIDEAQRVFRPRGNGKEVPPHVAALETHRHGGVDLVLITQHPMLIDNAVRRLAGKHRHVMRMFGTNSATIHEWDSVRVDCDKPGRREDSNHLVWKYDKKIFELYVSAELHTVKRSIPKRLIMLLCLPLLLIAAGLYMWNFVGKWTKGEGSNVPKQEVSAPGQYVKAGGSASQSQPGEQKSDRSDPIADLKQYVHMTTPRVAGLAFTAPKYDSITEPTKAPVPAACVMALNRCVCYSQQATRLDVEYETCQNIARNGYFQEFDPDGQQSDRNRSMAALDRPDGRLPLSRSDTTEKPMVAVLSGDGYGVLGSRSNASSTSPSR